jgi:hypothetical protein
MRLHRMSASLYGMSEPTARDQHGDDHLHDPDEIVFPTERERAAKAIGLGAGLGVFLALAARLSRRRRSAEGLG